MNDDKRFFFGVETEHAPATFSPDGRPRKTDNVAAWRTVLDRVIASGVPYLPGHAGVFTGYGRLYLETTGNHVELGVSPGTSPCDVVKTTVKYTKLLTDAVGKARESIPGLTLLKNNRDYISGCTWGAHESYAIRVPFEVLRQALVPFLITRQVYAGSGTLQGNCFWLSPRAAFMARETGGSTTGDRAIYSTCRDEPLMKTSCFSRRLHLIVGDSLMTELGQWLRLGTTALVLRAAEENPRIGDEVAFSSPVNSIRCLSQVNPEGKQLFNPHLITVQRHYLRVVADLLDKHDLPLWCQAVWRKWAEVLDILEKDPMALDTQLDHFIKLKLLREFLQRRRKTWADLQTDESLHWQLALMDVRYHALPGGIFEMLDAEGALDHKLFPDSDTTPGSEADPFVLTSPPREALRSRLIKQLSGSREHLCDWTHIINRKTGAQLPMLDPFSDTCTWQRPKPKQKDAGVTRSRRPAPNPELLNRLRERALQRQREERSRAAQGGGRS